MGIVTLLLVGERLDVLDDRIGNAGDFLYLADPAGQVRASLSTTPAP